MTKAKWIVGALALVAAIVAVLQLERSRAGVAIAEFAIGTTPATLYRPSGPDPVPVVVVAHGFAGSQQIMQAYALTLARAGIAALTFDFEGHGRNPVPMSGDVDAIEGTTRLLVAETLRVVDHARALDGTTGQVALLGHSMATDIIVRAAAEDPGSETVVAVSMFSQAVDDTHPARLLAITGQWEPGLRAAALDALRLVDPSAGEGDTAREGDVIRRAVVAPNVEHVGVLYSAVALAEARDWIAEATGRSGGGWTAPVGPWLAVLLTALLALAWPAAGVLLRRDAPMAHVPPGRFAVALIVPALAAPLIATRIETAFLPVLVADYLLIHFLIYGVLQIALLLWAGVRPGPVSIPTLAFIAVWGIALFGLALHRYGTNFWPVGDRITIIAALVLGTVPFLVGDAMATEAGRAGIGRRIAAKLAVFGGLSLAVALDFERLLFLVFIIPLVLLFFVVFGLIGRWAGQRGGALGSGIGLGLVLAWMLGVTFPLFVATGAG